MRSLLPESINTLSSQSQSTVSSLIRDMKIDKADFSSLINKLSDTRISTGYSPSVFQQFSSVNREFFIDMFRDADLRMRTYYSAANTTSLVLNSMVDVLFSEIEKIEKDLDLFSSYIDNYEFISGKDDLYNSSYIEKFDSTLNDYRFDGYNFTLIDRDGLPFDENGNGFVDKKSGTFKIGNRTDFINILGSISSLRIESNYSNYATTDTGFYNCLNDDKSDSWAVTVKSPVALNTETDMIKKYLNYDMSYINGAKTAIEIIFDFPQMIDSIRITPGSGNGMQLLQAVVFAQTDNSTISSESSSSESFVTFDQLQSLDGLPETYDDAPVSALDAAQATLTTLPLIFPVLCEPKLMNSTVDLGFIKTLVKKVILIINQPIYSMNEKTPSNSELTSKALYQISKKIKISKKNNPDIIQDMVYNLFLKNNSVKEIFKNSYFNESYYSFKYPYVKNNFLNKDYRKTYVKEQLEFDSLDKRWSLVLSNVFENFLIHSIGEKNNYFADTTYKETNSTSIQSYTFNSPRVNT